MARVCTTGVVGPTQPNKWIKSRYYTSTDFHPPPGTTTTPLPSPTNLISKYPLNRQDTGHYNVCVFLQLQVVLFKQ